jgi:hypothetical protein
MNSDFKELLQSLHECEHSPIHYLGKADLIRAKQTAGRLQDLADIEEINRADGRID